MTTMTAAESNLLPRGNGRVAKVEVYSWSTKDEPGTFLMVPKRQLTVDVRYQREKIANARVLEMAKSWSWIALGCLIVARRHNGEYLVIDGQHRKLAADKRSDINHLPCMVFDLSDVALEAQGFLNANTHRGPVKKIDRFKAELMAQDPIAIKVKDMAEKSGYRFSDTGNAQHTVACVGALQQEMEANEILCNRVWSLCVELYDGQQIQDRIFLGLCWLEKALLRRSDKQSIFDRHNREAILRIGVTGLMQQIRNAATYHNKGGQKVYAEGILVAMNKGRQSRRLDGLM